MIELPGQPEASRLLTLAAATPAHAYLFFGPRGAGKAAAADALAAALLETTLERVEHRSHPDLFVVEPEGEAILIDAIRELRADLHMRPFEASRRVYVLLEAETLGRDAANALLKSLEEPPPYAVFVLVSSDRGRLLPTIESRCQAVRFRPLAAATIAAALGGGEAATAIARSAGGDLGRARRLAASETARDRLAATLDAARDAAIAREFEPSVAAAAVVAVAGEYGEEAEADVRRALEAALSTLGEGPAWKRERQRLKAAYERVAKRRRRRAETDEVRDAVDAVIGFWRDVLCVAAGADDAVVFSDRLPELREVAARVGQTGAEAVLSEARETRRRFELPVISSLALEGLFHQIRLVAARGS